MKKTILNTTLLVLLLIGISKLLFRDSYVPIISENQYTFSYIGHIKWILNDWMANPSLLFESHHCVDCQYFGMYSRWVMIWLYVFLLPGQILQINPFIWYVFLSFFIQYVAIKYFLESIFPKARFGKQFVLVLSAFFTTIPYKWVQIEGQWEYPFVYYMFFIILGTYFRLIRNEKLSKRNIVLSISATTLIFNIGINHLPILFYTLLILTFLALRASKKKLLLISMLLLIFIPSFIFNIPMLASLLSHSDITQFSSYFSNPWPVLLSLGYLSNSNSAFFILFTALVYVSLLYFATVVLKKRQIQILVLLYICGTLLGILGKGQVFKIIFDNVPLFHTLRSAYRFVIFEHIFLIVLISYLHVHLKTHKYFKTIRYLFITACILNLVFMSSEFKVMNFTKIPSAYENTYKLIHNDNCRYIYFPTKLNTNHTYSSDYSYGNIHAGFYWWENPFESWYPSRNIHHPTLHMTDSELDMKILDLYNKNDHDGIINTLKYAGINYIIFDRYYKWSREAPKFDSKTFFSDTRLKKVNALDKIEIYSIR